MQCAQHCSPNLPRALPYHGNPTSFSGTRVLAVSWHVQHRQERAWVPRAFSRGFVCAPSGATEAKVEEMRARGARIDVESVDVGNPEQLKALFDGLAEGGAAVRGIFHAAGVLDDGLLAQQTPERFAKVMAAKVTGSWNLHRASLGLELDSRSS